jgi:thiol-disulfide isomerase/thioredoxin
VRTIPAAWRWALLVLIVAVALAIALLSRGPHENHTATAQATHGSNSAVSEQQRVAAGLADCPRPGGQAASHGPLAGVGLQCLADGRPIELTAALAGKPALLNLWAYWCQPCAEELPALQRYADRAGPAITVLTVHTDPDEAKGLARLSDLGVRLPGVEDADAKVRAAVGAPAVLPVSVLVRADGSIAELVVRPFTSVDDIARTVAAELGVPA